MEVKIWTFVIVTGLSTFFLQHGWCKDSEVSPFKDIAIPENIGTITKVRQEEPLNLFDAWRHLKIHYRDESGGATNEILVVIVRPEDREARDTIFNDIVRTAKSIEPAVIAERIAVLVEGTVPGYYYFWPSRKHAFYIVTVQTIGRQRPPEKLLTSFMQLLPSELTKERIEHLQQDESTVPVKAAPSASSPVR